MAPARNGGRLAEDGCPSRAGEVDRLQYRVDRTEGQEYQVARLGVEKATLVAQLRSWFGDLGLPVVALRGYGSQTYCDDIAADVLTDGRPAALIYARTWTRAGRTSTATSWTVRVAGMRSAGLPSAMRTCPASGSFASRGSGPTPPGGCVRCSARLAASKSRSRRWTPTTFAPRS